MPRTHWRPNLHIPVGFAIPLLEIRSNEHDRKEDKPTVLVDPYADGMELGLIEAVCTALEVWEPQFWQYVDPPSPATPKMKDTRENAEPWDTRRIPVFRGKHADRVRAFQNDIVQYRHAHQVEPSKQVMLKIASKYVHIRVTPMQGTKDHFGHADTTRYHREVIRPHVRRSDREWNRDMVIMARQAVIDGLAYRAHDAVAEILADYDENHDTALLISYRAEADALSQDEAPLWEHWRLVAYFVQDVVDNQFVSVYYDSPAPARKTAAKKTARKVAVR